jgi:hypothetical protein
MLSRRRLEGCELGTMRLRLWALLLPEGRRLTSKSAGRMLDDCPAGGIQGPVAMEDFGRWRLGAAPREDA